MPVRFAQRMICARTPNQAPARGGPYPMPNGRFERLCRLRFSGQQRHDGGERDRARSRPSATPRDAASVERNVKKSKDVCASRDHYQTQ